MTTLRDSCFAPLGLAALGLATLALAACGGSFAPGTLDQNTATERNADGSGGGSQTGQQPGTGSSTGTPPPSGGTGAYDSGEATQPPPSDPHSTEGQWLQLSTDDSTSMASAQLFKGGFSGWALKPHEFVNYYDPPADLFDGEGWAVQGTPVPGIELGLKAETFGGEVLCDANGVARVGAGGSAGSGETTCDCVEPTTFQGAGGSMGDGMLPEPCGCTEPPPPEMCEADLYEMMFHMRADSIPHETRRNWNIFLCVDVSGSMRGDRIAFVRDALVQMQDHLKEGDQITLVTFESVSHDVFIGLEASGSAAEIASSFQALQAGGSTNMIAGLRRTYELAQQNFDPTMLQRVIVFSDGNANVGDTDIATFSQLTRMNGQEGIYLSGVGVGTSYDWDRMDQLTDAGKGAHVFLPDASEVDLIFGDYFPKLVEVAADEIAIEMTLPAGISLESFSGEETSTDPNQRLQNIVLAAGDDMSFLARFVVTDPDALSQGAVLKVTLRPLSTATEIVYEETIESLSDLLIPTGQLFERTRIVDSYGRWAAGYPGATIPESDLRSRVDAYDPNDWGVAEIASILGPPEASCTVTVADACATAGQCAPGYEQALDEQCGCACVIFPGG